MICYKLNKNLFLMMTIAVAMGADFSSVLVWDLFADLVWYQLAFFNWDGVWNLDWYLVAHFSWFVVAFGFDDLTNSWFADSFWNYSTSLVLNLSGNLYWYLGTDMLDVNSTMRSWSGVPLSFAWSSCWLSFTLVKTFTSEGETMRSFLGVVTIILRMWNWSWSWGNWSRSDGQSSWGSVNGVSNNTRFMAVLVFDILALFFVGGVINGLVNWFANTFWVVVANLIRDSVGYWVTYFFWDIMTLWLVISFVFGYWVSFAYSFGDIFTSGGVGGIINGMAFSNRFRMD